MPQTTSTLSSRIVLGLVATMGLVIAIGINVQTWRELEFLERTATSVEGQIIKKDCSNHGRLRYVYPAYGTKYQAYGSSCGLSCRQASVGDTIKVIYSSEKPQLSRCHSLKVSQENVESNFFLIAFASLLAGFAIYRITRIDPTA